jgi:4-diphosphocytidyl-2-C-methyl-D-erythritol kinase
MISFPNAKLNLGLNITSKRMDGFHSIESVFIPLPALNDVLEIIENTESNDIEFTSSGIAIPGNSEDNLCVKAYHKIKAIADVPPIKIHLHKNIPIGAGLGGGSADAAFFIKLMNEKFSLNLNQEVQFSIAAELGSDCAFFLHNTACFATGRGEILKPFTLDLSAYTFVLIFPQIHISTKEAYAGVKPEQPISDLMQDILNPVSEWKNRIKNDFESSIFKSYPLLEEIKNELYFSGASYASMSGSGSTMYGIFPKTTFDKKLTKKINFEKYMIIE